MIKWKLQVLLRMYDVRVGLQHSMISAPRSNPGTMTVDIISVFLSNVLSVLLSFFSQSFALSSFIFIMPGEVITEPNPKPQPSHLPDYVEKLSVKLNHENKDLDQNACDSLLKFRRAASYIAAGKRSLLYI